MSSLEKTSAKANPSATTDADIRAVAERLRARRQALGSGSVIAQRAEQALAQTWDVWRTRLTNGWEPPARPTDTAAGAFPWAQVRVSLAGLVSAPPLAPPAPNNGGASAGDSVAVLSGSPIIGGGGGQRGGRNRGLVALILAGNTPLLAWPALCAALLAGKAVFVKMSRSETAWPRLFVEALRTVDPDLAGLIHLDVWPGDDGRTAALLQTADIVIAYGGDNALAALRTSAAQTGAPFHGFGHAVSVGVVLRDADLDRAAHGFARDVLMYDQAGCLSPQAIFVEDGDDNAERAAAFAERLVAALPDAANALGVTPSPDAGRARTVRQARQMALFTPGVRVVGDSALRWTVIAHAQPATASDPTGFAVIRVLPQRRAANDLPAALGRLRGFLSSAGVAGTVTDDLRAVLEAEGVTRICPPGEMQAPPLDWRNEGVDLSAVLWASQ